MYEYEWPFADLSPFQNLFKNQFKNKRLNILKLTASVS